MNRGDFSGEEWVADDLTWREQEVLALLAERLTNREIADRLHLAESTVKDYVGSILSKLFVKNRRQAVERAMTLGLLGEGPASAPRSPTFFPPEPTVFVGREKELADIKKRLQETRLLTLTGPGGIGKTRLALRAASEAAAGFEDGCFFVPLAPILSVDHLVQTVAEALKFPLATQEDPRRQLLRYLRDKRLLLVMDNFEHLLDGAGVVSEILQAAPGIQILATSRERLNLQSEAIVIVNGMAYPDPDMPYDVEGFDAITLFVQSARKMRPGYDPSRDEFTRIAAICQAVGGMPLGIELAAAWLHILSVDEILAELEKDLDILATGVRDAPQRHRSIRAVFDTSWSLLDLVEQVIFMQLSVFRRGFTRQAAQQVTGASLRSLAGLVEKSFLNHDPDSGRLEMHELVRQYAQERLERTSEDFLLAQEAHAAYYADFLQEHWRDLKGPRQMQALAEIEADIQNVRTAWRYYLGQADAPKIWKFINGLWHVYWIRWWNHAGMELFEEAVQALQEKEGDEFKVLKALAMAYQSFFMGWLDLAEEGYKLAIESLQILEGFDRHEATIFALYSLGLNAYLLARYEEEYQVLTRMIRIASEIDDKWLLGLVLFGGGMGALVMEKYEEARRLAEWELDLLKDVGDVIYSTLPLIVLGHAALGSGELEEAREYYLRCLKIAQRTGFPYAIQTASKYLGKVNLSLGRHDEAEKYLYQSLKITQEIGFVRDIVNLMYEFARLRTVRKDPEGAVELLALVIQHPASQQTRMLDGRIRDSAEWLLAEIESDIPRDTFEKSVERGRGLDLDVILASL